MYVLWNLDYKSIDRNADSRILAGGVSHEIKCSIRDAIMQYLN